ncbi:hypothetical protein RND71_029349 [Anisodus tanguticus]|uniref:Uncharacterized protein n=1 Tax=Anisodus tanguticus TaxID=243964 RepID=A0AAE1V4H9_9SOLA|nr:hypothetical protein RND71_029349 [Anisodus tanguticus]
MYRRAHLSHIDQIYHIDDQDPSPHCYKRKSGITGDCAANVSAPSALRLDLCLPW